MIGFVIKKSFIWQLLQALYYCNINRVIHRDLKPQNLLITKDLKLKLADFGLSRMFVLPMGKMTHEIITLWYRPPEVLLGLENYTTKVDSWSIGCIMAEMISNKPLFPGDSEIGQLFKIFQISGTPNEEIWPGITTYPEYKITFPKWRAQNLADIIPELDEKGIDLMNKFLTLDPDKRITIKEAINHVIFISLNYF
jgi:serine/threonine protein kinase